MLVRTSFSVIERQQLWYLQTSTSCHTVLSSSTSPVISLDEEVAGAGYLPRDVTNRC